MNKKIISLALVGTSILGSVAFPVFAAISYQQKITASDATTNSYFGSDVAVNGNTMIVGSSIADAKGTNSGAAYVYKRDVATEAWAEKQKLVASDGAVYDYFGQAVAMNEKSIVIGADGRRNDHVGAVYIFSYDLATNSWTEKQKLTPADNAVEQMFGTSLALIGNTLVVGSKGYNNNSGSAYIYTYDTTLNAWVEKQKLVASEASLYFGKSLGLTNNYLVIGSSNDNSIATASGTVYVYKFDSVSNTWLEHQKLKASNVSAYLRFGNDVAIHANRLVVGTYADHYGALTTQAAYVFQLNLQTQQWVETAILKPSNNQAQYFGESVAIFGTKVLVGATGYAPDYSAGTAYLYTLNSDLKTYQETTIANPQTNGKFGSAVAITQSNVVVTDIAADDSFTGAAYIFKSTSF